MVIGFFIIVGILIVALVGGLALVTMKSSDPVGLAVANPSDEGKATALSCHAPQLLLLHGADQGALPRGRDALEFDPKAESRFAPSLVNHPTDQSPQRKRTVEPGVDEHEMIGRNLLLGLHAEPPCTQIQYGAAPGGADRLRRLFDPQGESLGPFI
jgi:hypothetical protein